MKAIYSLLLLAAASTGAYAQQTEETVFDLTSSESFSQCTQSSIRYDRDNVTVWSFSTYSGITMYSYNITNGYYDDYLTTPDLDLSAGTMYVVYCNPSCYLSTDEGYGSLSVLLGQGDDLEQYRTLLRVDNLPYGYSTPLHEVTFTVPESGKYRVSFNAGPRAVKLRETRIMNRGESPVPNTPHDFTVTPDPDGALDVTVSFTMPGTTITGQPLSDTAYNLYRGVQKIRNAVAAAPGEKVTYTETRGESGNVVYAVEVICGGETSEKVSAESYVGPETPTAPTDLSLGLSDGRYTVSWAAPATGVHGVALAADRLSYTVSRILDGEAVTVAEGLGECSFAEAIEPDGLQTLRYSVTAVYGTQATKSEAAESPMIKIGTATLPFADSFAGAAISPLWDNEIVYGETSGNYYWQAKEKMDSRVLATEAYDGDGGLLMYNSYTIRMGNSARLSTPPFTFNEGDKPVMTFVMYHIANGADIVKVQVSCDYGEWVDVPESTFTPKGEPVNAWSQHEVNLESVIPADTKTYRVALTAESNYGQDIVIDAVRIFNLLEKDLELVSLSVPESVKAGNEVELTVKVANNGSGTVSPDDYTIEIDSDFPEVLEIGGLTEIPSLGSASYTVKFALNSLHLVDTDSFSFTARVGYAGDQAEDNNTSGTYTLSAGYSAGNSATDLAATRDADITTLSWTAAKDLEYEPVAIVESFEDETFADGSTGPFNGWTIIDLDGQAGDRWYTAGGSTFNLAVNAGTPALKDGSNVLGVTVKSNVQQDDWIISPILNCQAGSTMNLDFLMGCKQTTSSSNSYEVSLLYTTAETYDNLNPQNDFTMSVGSIKSTSTNDRVLPQDNKMHELSFSGIPAEARYVALHFTAKGTYNPAMWVDNIRLTEVEENPLLGYRVYGLNGEGCLHEGLLSAEATDFTMPEPAVTTYADSRKVFVSAVYPDGEARPSNIVDINEPTSGVESVTDTDSSAPAEYFNLQGVRVAAPKTGIYIRRQGNKASKVVVK